MQLDVPVHRAAESSCSAHAPSMKTEWLQSLREARHRVRRVLRRARTLSLMYRVYLTGTNLL